MGIGWVCPNPTEVCLDIENGLYGKRAQEYYTKYKDIVWARPSQEIYACRCGNIEEKLHIMMFDDCEPPLRNRVLTPRQKCSKCGSIMRMLKEPPAKIPCPYCGGDMELDEFLEILWD